MRGVLLAVGIGVIFALTGIARAQGHGGTPPEDEAPDAECRRSCHILHCHDWLLCPEDQDPERCELQVSKEESECIRQCRAPTMRGGRR